MSLSPSQLLLTPSTENQSSLTPITPEQQLANETTTMPSPPPDFFLPSYIYYFSSSSKGTICNYTRFKYSISTPGRYLSL
jgi:hypothetical protein